MSDEPIDQELEDWRVSQGYIAARRLPDGRISAVVRTIFQWRLLIGTMRSVEHAFCYESLAGAIEGMLWDPDSDRIGAVLNPPGGWHKSVVDGRRNPKPSEVG